MKTYIGYSLDENLRWRAASGGVGSSILKYLFETKQIETAITFTFDSNSLRYIPKLIYSFDDYMPIGSIYQEIDLIQFIKNHLNDIHGGFACFSLPCQSRAIKYHLERTGHFCYIIGLTCSSQQSIEATEYLLKRIHIDRKDVTNIQYRGNGWPSGITIMLRSGEEKFVSNNFSIWTKIFHSRLFIMPRCFRCNDTLNLNADITLADPWLKDILSSETIGQTLIFENVCSDILIRACQRNYIQLQYINERTAVSSQQGTINRKEKYRNKLITRKILLFVNKNSIYKSVVKSIPFLFELHCKAQKIIE